MKVNIKFSLVHSFVVEGGVQGVAMAMERNERHEVPARELDYLASRYLLIIPEDLRGDRARLGFQLEKAYWEHINQFEESMVLWMENNFKLQDFSLQIFPRVPWLRDNMDIVWDIIADFEDYKKTVPTYGVILLNETLDKVLLVRSYWGRRWGFPKGKVNEGESGHECAAREAREEIGFNLDSMLDPDTWINEVEFEV